MDLAGVGDGGLLSHMVLFIGYLVGWVCGVVLLRFWEISILGSRQPFFLGGCVITLLGGRFTLSAGYELPFSIDTLSPRTFRVRLYEVFKFLGVSSDFLGGNVRSPWSDTL